VPSTPYDVKGLIKTALRDDNPVIFIEHKGLYNTKGHVPEAEYLIPFGQAKVVRSGKDVTVVCLGRMVQRTLEAAEQLEALGIEIEVIDLRTIAPLDKQSILTSLSKTGHLAIVDEAYATCGMAAEIAAIAATEALYELDAPVVRICTLPAPHTFSPTVDAYLVPSTGRIVREIAEMMGKAVQTDVLAGV
jgi:pyruvate dehydrogenase E1 component beta subunit